MCVLSMSTSGKAAKPSQRAGFALVVALSMMSFMLLLLLSICTLVQVESAAANQRRNTLQAREHARLALLLAIGQLQQHAGHDARVSARAEILGDGNYDTAARYWTGIWNTRDPNSEPKWLVSGDSVPLGNAADRLIQLVGPGSVGNDTSQYVAAPSVDVLNHRGQRSARIAWWIGDQGVKASCGAPPPQTGAGPNYLTAPAAQNMGFACASSQGLEALFPDYQRDNSARAEQLERVQSLS